MKTILVKNVDHGTEVKVRVNEEGETELDNSTLSRMRRTLCPNSYSPCTCSKGAAGETGGSENELTSYYRGGKVYLRAKTAQIAMPKMQAEATACHKSEKQDKDCDECVFFTRAEAQLANNAEAFKVIRKLRNQCRIDRGLKPIDREYVSEEVVEEEPVKERGAKP